MSKKRKKTTPAASPDPATAAAAAESGGGVLDHIVADLRSLAVPIADLVPDPANALKHGDKDLTGTAASMRVYKVRTPLVVNRTNNVVLKGNGSLEAAKRNGWMHLPVVWVDDDPATAAGYSIADNHTGRQAEWDKEALDKLLRSVNTEDQDLATMLDELAQDLDLVPAADSATPAQAPIEHKWQVIIECKSEEQQRELLERFDGEGLPAKALTV